MSVDQATVRRIARLARIAVPEGEIPKLQGELNAILGFVEELNNVNVACDGQRYKVVLADGVGTALVTASGTASVVANTITITVAAQDSKLVGQVVVTLYQ